MAKTELQELGEETDDMAKSTSKLREQLLALTGVDIMLDENTFKSTKDIILEISDAWEHMTDIQRAATGELVAGKNRSNAFYAMVQNADEIREVLAATQQATGSAMEENERYMESIDGHLKELGNTWQKVWVDTINSQLIKDIIDLGTAIGEIVDALGGLDGILTPLLATVVAFNLDKVPGLLSKIAAPLISIITMFKGVNAKQVFGAFIGKDIVSTTREEIKALGDLRTNTEAVKTANEMLATSEKSVAAAMALRKLATMAIVTSIVLVIQYIKKQREEELALRKESMQTAQDSAKSYQELLEAYKNYQSVTSDSASTEEQLKTALDGVETALGNKAEHLKTLRGNTEAYNKELERQIELEKEQRRGDAVEAIGNAKKSAREKLRSQKTDAAMDKSSKAPQSGSQALASVGYEFLHGSTESLNDFNANTLIEQYKQLQEQIKDTQEQLVSLQNLADDDPLKQKWEQQLADLRKQEKDIKEEAEDLIDGYKAYINSTFDPDNYASLDALADEMVQEFAGNDQNYKQMFEDIIRETLPDTAEAYDAVAVITDAINKNVAQANKTIVTNQEEQYRDIYEYYKEINEDIDKLGIDTSQHIFGNIDLNARKPLEWTKENLKKYKKEIDALGWKDLEGSISTVQGSQGEFGEAGVPIAYTPMLADENGNLSPLSPDTLSKYLNWIIDSSTDEDGKVDIEFAMKLDKGGVDVPQFIDEYGRQIKGLIAGIGEEAGNSDYAMHYVDAQKYAIKDLEEAAKECGVSVAELINKLENGIPEALQNIDAEALQEAFSSDDIVRMTTEDFAPYLEGVDSIEQLKDAYKEYLEDIKELPNFQKDFTNALNKTKDSIDDTQKDLSTLSSIVTDAFDGLDKPDEFIDGMQEVAAVLEKLPDTKIDLSGVNSIKDLGKVAKQVANEQLEALISKLKEVGATDEFISKLRQSTQELINYQTAINSAVNGMSSVSSAYQTIRGAMDEYNQSGQMTFGTLSSLLQLEPQYLSMLQMENGQISINQAALEGLVEAKKQDGIMATFAAEKAELDALAEQKAAEQAGNSAQAHAALSDVLNIAAGQYDAVASAAMRAAAFEAMAAGRNAVKAGASQKEVQAIHDKYNAMRKEIASITVASQKSADKVLGYSSKAGKGAGGAAKDAAKEAKQQIDNVLSHLKQALQDGGITYKEYLDRARSLTDQAYAQGKISAKDYHDYKLSLMREEIDMWKQVASAAQFFINEEKEALQEQLDTLNDQKDALQEQIDDIQKAYEDKIYPLQRKIRKIKKTKIEPREDKIYKKQQKINKIETKYEDEIWENELQIMNYKDQIRPLQKIVDEHQRIIDALNEQIRLLEVQKRPYEYQIDDIEKIQRTNDYIIKDLERQQKVYERQQKTIEKAIKVYERQKKLNDRKIKQLEQQQKIYEKQQKALQKQIKNIEKQQKLLEKMKNPYKDQIESLKKQKEELQKVNEERNRALSLQKAQYELDKAENQRTAYVYTNGGFEYRADEEAKKSAKDNLADVKFDNQIAGIDDQIDAAQSAIDLISDKIQSLQDNIDTLNDKIDELQDPIDAIQEKIDVWNDKNEELEWNIEQLNWKIDELQIPIDTLQDRIDALNNANDEWDYKISQLQQKIDVFEDAIEKLNRAIQTQEDIMGPYKRRIEEINYAIDDLSAANEKLKDDEERLVHPIERSIKTLQDQIDKYERKIALIERTIDELEDERDVTVKALNDQIKAIDKQEKAINRQMTALDRLSKQWDKVGKAIERIKNQELLESIFGPDWQTKIKNGEGLATAIQGITSAYRNLQQESKKSVSDLDASSDAMDKAGGAASNATGPVSGLASALGDTGGSTPAAEKQNVYTDTGGGFGNNYGNPGSKKGFKGSGNGLRSSMQAANEEMSAVQSNAGETDTVVSSTSKNVAQLQSDMESAGKTFTVTKKGADDAAKTASKASNQITTSASTVESGSTAITNAVTGLTAAVQTNFGEINTYAGKAKQIVNTAVLAIESNTRRLKTSERVLTNIVTMSNKVKTEVKKILDETSKQVTQTEKKVSDTLKKLQQNVTKTQQSTKKAIDQVKKLTSLSGGLSPAVKSIKNFISKYLQGSGGIIKKSEEAKKKVTDAFDHNKGLRQAINSIKKFISDYLQKLKSKSDEVRSAIKKHWEGSALENAKSKINSLINSLSNLSSQSKEAKAAVDELANIDASRFNSLISSLDSIIKKVDEVKKKLNELPEKKTVTIDYKNSNNNDNNGKNANGGRVEKYARGGRVKKFNISGALNKIAQTVGEDTMIAVKEGEGIFTKKQTDDLEEFIKLTPELVNASASLSKFAKLFTSLKPNNVNAAFTQNQISSGLALAGADGGMIAAGNMTNSNNFNLSIGDIHLNGVQDVDGLAIDIKNNLPNALLQVLTRR